MSVYVTVCACMCPRMIDPVSSVQCPRKDLQGWRNHHKYVILVTGHVCKGGGGGRGRVGGRGSVCVYGGIWWTMLML